MCWRRLIETSYQRLYKSNTSYNLYNTFIYGLGYLVDVAAGVNMPSQPSKKEEIKYAILASSALSQDDLSGIMPHAV